MIMRDFFCEPCNEPFEDLVSSDTRIAPCPLCGTPTEMAVSAPRLTQYNDLGRQAEALRKRSHAHTMKELKKEPEKHGFQAADKRPWNIRSQKKTETT
jgi:hypothetical protein